MFLILLVVGITVAARWWSGNREPVAAAYVTQNVIRGDPRVTVTATGTLTPIDQFDVGRELSGIGKTVAVDYNDRGDLEARLHAILSTLAPEDRRRLAKLGPPPYITPQSFQRRAVMLADFGSVERGKTFIAVMRETLFAMVRTYGVIGTVRALRNMNIVQRRLLPEMVPLDLLTNPPQLTVPVHFVFGAEDALTSAFKTSELPAKIGARGTTAIRLGDAAHRVHFDQPHVVRSMAERA